MAITFLKQPLPRTSIRFGGTIEMTPEEWLKVADNPRQRDTERHARKALARHLKKPSPAQAKVSAARLPDGTLIKLDGHTRVFLWSMGKLEAPEVVYVDVWECPDISAVVELYGTFDDQDAAETVTDQLSGAVREQKLTFQSEILTSNRYVAALRVAYELFHGQVAARNAEVYDLERYWTPQLKIIDQCGGTRKLFHTGILAAALICAARYGEDASVFWSAYAKRQGNKVGDEMDAVQALELRMLERSRLGSLNGRANSFKNIAYALSAFERYRRSEAYLVSGSGVRALQQAALMQWVTAALRQRDQ